MRKLVPFADAAKERGIHVYHLNIGQPDIETPKGALKALAETAKDLPASHGVLEYSHSAGIPSYRRALCNYYHRHGIDVTPNQIIVTTGGSEALQMAFTVCLNPGDEIIIPASCAMPRLSLSLATSRRALPCLPLRNSRKSSHLVPEPS